LVCSHPLTDEPREMTTLCSDWAHDWVGIKNPDKEKIKKRENAEFLFNNFSQLMKNKNHEKKLVTFLILLIILSECGLEKSPVLKKIVCEWI